MNRRVTIIGTATASASAAAGVAYALLQTSYSLLISLWVAGALFAVAMLPTFALARRHGMTSSRVRIGIWLLLVGLAYPVANFLAFGLLQRYETVGSIMRPEPSSASFASLAFACAMAVVVSVALAIVTRACRLAGVIGVVGALLIIAIAHILAVVSTDVAIALAIVTLGVIVGASVAGAARTVESGAEHTEGARPSEFG
jgi:hypothetical protein